MSIDIIIVCGECGDNVVECEGKCGCTLCEEINLKYGR